MLWDGTQLLDTAGHADNDDLATRLLGFRPTRYAPLGIEESLYAAAPDGQAQDEEDKDEADAMEYAEEADGG